MEESLEVNSIQFEWDDKKSHISKGKHNLSMEEAVALFKENYNSTVQIQLKYKDETRYAIVFYKVFENKTRYYRMIYTLRKNIIRIISIHRTKGGEELSRARNIWNKNISKHY